MLTIQNDETGSYVFGTKHQKVFFRGTIEECRHHIRNVKSRVQRRAKKDAYESVGLIKVRGALGGVYYE